MAIWGESRHSQIRWPALVLRSNTSDVLGVEKINVLIMYWRSPCSDSWSSPPFYVKDGHLNLDLYETYFKRPINFLCLVDGQITVPLKS